MKHLFLTIMLSFAITGMGAGNHPLAAADKKAAPIKEKAAKEKTANEKPDDKKTVDIIPPVKKPENEPEIVKVDMKAIAAKKLFGFVLDGADMKAKSIGYYTRGCLAGGQHLEVDGPAWQAMRLSRNRNWGHPKLIAFIEKVAKAVKAEDGWPGVLVGDLSQPRGGPMLSGHRSHQVGLDADIWLNPMPNKRLTYKEREETSAISMLDKTGLKVNKNVWSDAHVKVIKRAASFKEVARVLVHPAIKKALCEAATGDRSWLHKIRPWYGHHYHMHIRMNCPNGGCKNQPAPPKAEGCDKQLDYWFALLKKTPKPPCSYGNLSRKEKKWICTCPSSLKRVAVGKAGGAKCVLPDGTLPKPKVVRKNLDWMPKACRPVLDDGKPPLLKARMLGDQIDLPVRKAVAKAVAAAVEPQEKAPEAETKKAATPKTIEGLIEKNIDPKQPMN